MTKKEPNPLFVFAQHESLEENRSAPRLIFQIFCSAWWYVHLTFLESKQKTQNSHFLQQTYRLSVLKNRILFTILDWLALVAWTEVTSEICLCSLWEVERLSSSPSISRSLSLLLFPVTLPPVCSRCPYWKHENKSISTSIDHLYLNTHLH